MGLTSNKIRFLAAASFAGLVVAGLIGTGLWQQSEYYRQAQEEIAGYASRTQEEISSRCLSLPPVEEARCTIEARHEQRADERDEQSLYTQKTMALWTALMGSAALIGMILSAVGVFLIWTTFKETKVTSEAATKSAEAATKSAEVAEQALVGVERPFLHFNPELRGSDRSKQRYSFTNYGRTPCVIVYSSVQYIPITLLYAPEPMTPSFLHVALTPQWNVVPAGGKTPVESVDIDKPIVEDAELAGRWMLHGCAIYQSLTGEFFESGFGFYRDVSDGDKWRRLSTEYNYDERREPGTPRKQRGVRVSITVADERDGEDHEKS